MLRKFWYERTIRAKLLIAIAVINLIGAGAAGVIAVVNARQATQVEMEASLEVAKHFVRATIQGLAPDGKVDNLAKKINQLTSRLRLAQLRHVRISIADASGNLVSVQDAGQGRGNQLPRAPAWFASLVAPQLAPQEFSVGLATSGDSTFIIEQPIKAVPRVWTLGTVVIAGEPADEIAEAWHDTYGLALVWLAIDALIIGALFLVLGRMLEPLANLARGMMKLEDGHYATRIDEPKVQELAAIAERFNFLAEALGRSRAENAQLYGQLIMVQEEERREIANEIHDEASPCLFGITANALSVQHLTGARSDRKTVEIRSHITEILKVTDRLNQMNRMLLKKLRPVALGRVALADLIDDLCREMQKRYPKVALTPTIKTRLPSYGEEIDLTVYRCVQEGVTNAIRHGKAGSVRVEIFEKRRTRAEGKFEAGPALHLTIQDDGNGISPETPAGFGLTVMRERIHALDGSFIIESAPTRGTTLLIILPIQNLTAEGAKPKEGIQVS